MSEQFSPTLTPRSIVNENAANYEEYRQAFNRTEQRKRLLWGNGTYTTDPGKYINANLEAPNRALSRSAIFFAQHEDTLKMDAVFDATNAGVELNLPAGLPKTATNVQVL